MSLPPVLIVPGRGNSEAGHWQTLLEASIGRASRVDQAWNDNDIVTWAGNIDQAVQQAERAPLVVAHSFGCLATAYAQIVLGTPIGATLFVAPAAPERFGLDTTLFAHPLGRPGLLVASENDPWLSFAAATALAQHWRIPQISLGRAGHVNVASGYGRWPDGEALAETLRNDLDAIQSVSGYRHRIATPGAALAA
ncbi:RBBP9/YdeN family alpha/beta hydrolase [Propionivibrio dicarboxylicus]|uniref:Alpha/beta hydrolase n=1 Tax=Propionivibrio dicarboxylicus TaxID=83767 RepID=A0A1G8I057_9RHOO|nr:alpha/beta fold hydrolase [Propionivibrio dicarboxylicus]SDI12192.1 hypothetical protein SAMN05660652_02889 [Propionivibrio dicarboxylicus]